MSRRDLGGELVNSKLHDKIFVITGMPRSGTTYLAAVLHNPPAVVTISEAGGQWKQLIKAYGRTTRVFDIFSDYRVRILRGEKVYTLEGTPGFEGKQRIDTWNQKKTERKIKANHDFKLGMKNPEVFLELLPVFRKAGTKCVITARHPVYVINSWVKKVQKRLSKGRTIEGTFANGECITYDSPSEDPLSGPSETVKRLYDFLGQAAPQNVVGWALKHVQKKRPIYATDSKNWQKAFKRLDLSEELEIAGYLN